MDVLAAVMRELHFAAAGYRKLELAAPWAISFSQAGLRGIHIVIKGRCEVVFDHAPVQPLESGDLVIAPRADAHILRSPGATLAPGAWSMAASRSCSTSAAAARRTMPNDWIVQGADPQGADFSLVGGK